jgi:hypothetical protein
VVQTPRAYPTSPPGTTRRARPSTAGRTTCRD